eukprot:scaffold4678_cov242-Pinguiococcus_pyrenoidosus.AAC.11
MPSRPGAASWTPEARGSPCQLPGAKMFLLGKVREESGRLPSVPMVCDGWNSSEDLSRQNRGRAKQKTAV